MKQKFPQDYDAYWKALLPILIEDFLQLCLPEVYPYIDFSHPPQFLEQELHKIRLGKGKKGKKYLDKLVDVKLKDGGNKWLLIHIEFQHYEDAKFAQRMFRYYYRIWDHYEREITALAFYTGKTRNQPSYYFSPNFTRCMFYGYYTYSVKDADKDALLASENPFALAVLAAKYLLESGVNLKKRYKFKYKLIKLAFAKSYSHDKIRALMDFIYLLLPLEEEMESRLVKEITEELNQDKDMKTQEIKLDYLARMHELFYGETLEDRIKKTKAKSSS